MFDGFEGDDDVELRLSGDGDGGNGALEEAEVIAHVDGLGVGDGFGVDIDACNGAGGLGHEGGTIGRTGGDVEDIASLDEWLGIEVAVPVFVGDVGVRGFGDVAFASIVHGREGARARGARRGCGMVGVVKEKVLRKQCTTSVYWGEGRREEAIIM